MYEIGYLKKLDLSGYPSNPEIGITPHEKQAILDFFRSR